MDNIRLTQEEYISRNGLINLTSDRSSKPCIGLDLEEAETLLKKKLVMSFIGTISHISLAELRSIKCLYVVGEAYKPGLYNVST